MFTSLTHFSSLFSGIIIRKELPAYRKYAVLTAIVSSLIGATSYQAKAQTFDYEHNIPAFNFFQKSTIGLGTKKGKLEYYGSGDVDKNDTIDYRDVQAIYDGVKNDMADVNGDQKVDSIDAEMIKEYVDGIKKYLPAHRNEVSHIEGADSTGVSKRYLARVDWLKKMIAVAKMDTNTYVNNYYECTQFAEQTQIEFSGLENFENYPEYQKYIDHGAKMNRFAIPVQTVATEIDPDKRALGGTSPSGHRINSSWVGSKDPNVKGEITKFEDYYFWDPQTGQEVHPGDWDMNDNGPVTIRAQIYMPYQDGTNWSFGDEQLVPFNLSAGVATVNSSGVSSYLITKNPELMNPQVTGVTGDTVTINYKSDLNIADYFTNVSATANTENYKDRIKLNEWTSDTTSTSQYDKINYDVKENFQAMVDVGMQPPYSAIVSTSVKVRDIEAPTGTLTQTSAEAEPGITPEDLAKKYVSNVSDNSGLPVDTVLTADTQNSYTDASYYTHTNVNVKLVDKFGNENDLGTFESQIRKYATGIADVNSNEHSLQLKVIGNPVTSASRLQVFSHNYLQKGEIVIYNSQGKLIHAIEVDNLSAGAEQEIQYDGWSALSPGIYLLTFTGNGHQVKEKVQVK